VTNFCENLGEDEAHKQIDTAFETWQSVCGVKFKRVEFLDADIKISFLNDKINCPYKLNGRRGGTLAHEFYPRKGSICGDIHFN